MWGGRGKSFGHFQPVSFREGGSFFQNWGPPLNFGKVIPYHFLVYCIFVWSFGRMQPSFPELRGAPQFWKSLFFQKEALNQPVADQMVSRWLHHRRWPSILKSALQFWKSDIALKIHPIWGVKINNGPQFLSSASAIYVACAFCKKFDQNRANMTAAAAQRKHHRV